MSKKILRRTWNWTKICSAHKKYQTLIVPQSHTPWPYPSPLCHIASGRTITQMVLGLVSPPPTPPPALRLCESGGETPHDMAPVHSGVLGNGRGECICAIESPNNIGQSPSVRLAVPRCMGENCFKEIMDFIAQIKAMTHLQHRHHRQHQGWRPQASPIPSPPASASGSGLRGICKLCPPVIGTVGCQGAQACGAIVSSRFALQTSASQGAQSH